jgi:hypothetical protein
MINNSHIIRPMLSFEDKDDFYFLQILKRRKDNPAMEKDMVVIDNFYIDSFESYDRKLPDVMALCILENARAYFRLNKRNYAKLGPHMLKRVVDIVFTENCKALRSAFDSVAGEFHSDPDKTWVVDVDNDKDVVFGDLCSTLVQLQRETHREPMMIQLPTKNGLHIITRPFNLQKFKEEFPRIDTHKDNPTLLYCP